LLAEFVLRLPEGVQAKLAEQIVEYAKLLEMPQVFGPGTLEPAKLN